MSASDLGQALSDYPRLRRRYHSRARASLRNRHRPFHHGKFEDEVEQSNGWPCRLSAGPSGDTNSSHPSREGHRSTTWWSSSFLLPHLISNGPHAATASPVQRNSVPSTGVPAQQSSLHAAAPGDLHRPSLEPGPSHLTHQHALRSFWLRCLRRANRGHARARDKYNSLAVGCMQSSA
jgi:hypothetical protein